MARTRKKSPLLTVLLGALVLPFFCCGLPYSLFVGSKKQEALTIEPLPLQSSTLPANTQPSPSTTTAEVSDADAFPSPLPQGTTTAANDQQPNPTPPQDLPSVAAPNTPPSPSITFKPRPIPEFREWNSLTGGFKTMAKLVGFTDGTLHLEKQDGKTAKVPLDRVAKTDRNYVHSIIREIEGSFVFVGKVQSVIDGDTFVAADEDQKTFTIDLLGADAPELKQEYGETAKKALEDKILTKSPWIEWKTSEEHGHILGVVYFDGRPINVEMIADGHAWFDDSHGDQPRYANAHQFAQKRKLGLWKDTSSLSPSQFRHTQSVNGF